MRKFVFLLLLMGTFGYARPLAIDTAWFRHVPSAHHLTYWFDNNSASAQELPLSPTSLQVDVSFLSLGVHTIHFYAVDSAGVVYPTASAMFFCPPVVGSDSTAAQQVVYWFDQDFANRNVSSLHTGPQLIDVSALAMGVHTLHSYVVGTDNTVYPTSSAMFFCPPSVESDSTAAQQVVYWFDQDFDNRHVSSLHSGPQLIDVSALAMGVHTLHSYVVGADNKAYPTTSVMFFRLPYIDSDSAEAQKVVYWFDQDYNNRQIVPLQAGVQMLDVSALSVGVHTLHSYVVGTNSTVYPTSSAMFFRPPAIGADSTAAQELVYWFDQDYNNRQITPLQAGVQMLDVTALPMGVHTLHSYVVGTDSTVYPTSSAMFFRPPAIGADSTAAQEVVYWFDQDYAGRQRTTLLSMSQTIDVSNLSTGVHTLHSHVMGVDGVSYPTTSSMFFRPPGAGSESMDGITQYYYWLNDDITKAHRVQVNPVTNPLQWYGLIPIDSIPFRSSYFHFEIDTAQQPHAYAKNTFHTLFMDDLGKFVMGDVAPFIDYRISQPVVSDTILPNTSETFPKVTNNSIKWFRLTAQRGDSLAFKTNRPCTIQLYSPMGEEIYRASGDTVTRFDGTHAWHDGTYYLTIHDATYSGNSNLTVEYFHCNKFAVLSQNVHRVGNGGVSAITFHGNGFDSISSVKFVLGTDTIHHLHMDTVNRSTLVALFDFEGVDTGFYDAVFDFTGTQLLLANNLTVEAAIVPHLITTINYPSSFVSGGYVIYSYTITNTGNVTAFNVPIHSYISTNNRNNISYIKLEGLDLGSMASFFPDNLLSDEEKNIFAEYEQEYGNDYMYMGKDVYDSIQNANTYVLSNHFFYNIAPYESKQISLTIKSAETVDVWFSTPLTAMVYHNNSTDSLLPRPQLIEDKSTSTNLSDNYCCVASMSDCILNDVSIVLSDAATISSLFAIITAAIPVVGEGSLSFAVAADAASCIAGGANFLSSAHNDLFCNRNARPNLNYLFNRAFLLNSITGTATACIKSLVPQVDVSKLFPALNKVNWLSGLTTLAGTPHNWCSSNDFFNKWFDCPPRHHDGGSSTAYYPVDPNEIVGFTAESGSTYMPDTIQTIGYYIECENDPLIAQSAAHRIVIVDTLDTAQYDISTFRPTSVTIGNHTQSLNGLQQGVFTMDLRPEMNSLAEVVINLDTTHSVARWIITAIDPTSLEPITSVDEGVLPPNTDGNGTAKVYYQIGLRHTFPDGAVISNRAYITFDFEDAIATPVWTNIIDAISPTSRIAYGNIEGDTLSLSFQATDNRSGVWRYDVFGRSDSLDSWHLVNTGKTSVQRLAVDSLLTDFYVLAIDSAGNRENKTPQVEYNTTRGIVGPTVTTYQIQFVNFDNTVLRSYRLPMGATPAYLGSTPSRNADAHYSYRFSGWTPAIVPVAGNAVYHAVYDSIPNRYRICFFDHDSTLLQSDSLPYGSMPSYYSSIPTRPAVDSFVYAFVGWTPELMPVSGNADYRPVFDSMLYYQLPRYLVTFRNWNDSVLQSDSLTFGTLPHYWGMEPNRAGNAYCDYRFRDWSPRLVPVTESVVYTAVFDTLVHSYPVTFVNFNGAVLQQDTLPYGSMPVYRGNTPARRTTIQYTYSFVGWNPDIDTVHSAAVYTAVFDSVFSCISQYHYDNISSCDSVSWRGNIYATSGTYSERVEGVAYGCDSVYVLNLTINHSSYGTDVQTACDSLIWHGTSYTASTSSPTYVCTNAAGCDSVTTLHLTVNHSSSGTDVRTACDSLIWHGTTYTASTSSPTYICTNAAGCDSVVTLHLTVNHSSSGTEVRTACDSLIWHGTSYTASTSSPTYVCTNAAGCDSVTTLHLTVNHSSSGTDVRTACDSLTWHGTSYTASTSSPTYVCTNAAGCDSVTTLHLTVNHSSYGTDVRTACDSLTWHGTSYTASTSSPTYVCTNANGCDSTTILNLTIHYSQHDTINVDTMGAYTWNGTTYTESGTFQWFSQTEHGCDSIVTLLLVIHTVGINDVHLSKQTNLYPNPTNGIVIVDADMVFSIEVFDMAGRKVMSNTNSNQIDLSDLPAGTYILRASLIGGTSVNNVIKQ